MSTNQELPLALDLADRSLALERSSVALGTRCWVHVTLGDLQRARPDCEAAVREAATPVNEGMLAWLDGRTTEALRLWERAQGMITRGPRGSRAVDSPGPGGATGSRVTGVTSDAASLP